MKKIALFSAISIALLSLVSCGTMGGTTQQSANNQDVLGAILTGGAASNTGSQQGNGSQSLLGSLLAGLIGNAVPVTADNICGTWTYQSPECRFNSENALAQAGGAVAANTVESKLADLYASIGIKPGVCSFTFNKDNTCSILLGSRAISGTYTLDPKTRELSIVSSTGLIKLNGQVYYSITNLAILFDAQKLLTTAKMIATFTGKSSSTIGTVASILNNYQDMLIGMNLKKSN